MKKNIFTVDFEDWFVPLYDNYGIDNCTYQNQQRVQFGTRIILDLLKKHNCFATFFVLGAIAENCPDLVKEIQANGHEIASHGYSHKMITKMNESEFEEDIEKSLSILSKIVSTKISGYRAPKFSINAQTMWALDILKKFGFTYDSSVFPFNLNPDYGIKDAKTFCYLHSNGIIEYPLPCIDILGQRFPCTGGAYFRFFPYSLNKILIKKYLTSNDYFIFYIHPWELDIDQPKIKNSFFQYTRHYSNLKSTKQKIQKLFLDFQFISFQQLQETDEE